MIVNLIRNWSFEDGLAGWTYSPTSGMSVTNEHAVDGDWSLRLPGSGALIYQTFVKPVWASADLYFSCKAYGMIEATVEYADDTGTGSMADLGRGTLEHFVVQRLPVHRRRPISRVMFCGMGKHEACIDTVLMFGRDPFIPARRFDSFLTSL